MKPMIKISLEEIKAQRHEPVFNLTVRTAIRHAFPNNENQHEKIFQLLDISRDERITIIITAKTEDFIPELTEAHHRITTQ